MYPAHESSLPRGSAYGSGEFLKGDQVKGKNDLQADITQVGAARNPRSDERHKGNRNQKWQRGVGNRIDKHDAADPEDDASNGGAKYAEEHLLIGALLMRSKRDANSKVVHMALHQDGKKEEVA